MKPARSQIIILAVMGILTMVVCGVLIGIFARNSSQVSQVLLAAPTLPVTAQSRMPEASPMPTATPIPTPTPEPTPTPTPVAPQTRYDLQVAREPENPALRVQRGYAYMTLGAYSYAVDDFSVAVGLDTALAEAYIGRGEAKFYLKEWRSALQDFDQALALNPELADAYTRRGNLLSLRGEHVQALEALRQAVVLDETDPQKYVVLGDALLRSGAPDEAQLAYTTALSFEVRHVAAYVGRAMAWAELGDLPAAQADLTVALDIAPYDPVALNGQAWFNIWYLQEHSSDAERLAERAIAEAECDLERARYLHTLGLVYRHQGRYEEAIATLEEAARLALVEGEVVYEEIVTHLEAVKASQ